MKSVTKEEVKVVVIKRYNHRPL